MSQSVVEVLRRRIYASDERAKIQEKFMKEGAVILTAEEAKELLAELDTCRKEHQLAGF